MANITQKNTILQLLNAAEWVCGTTFLQNYLQEYRTRINELRKDGFTVEARRCTQHVHKAGMQEWSLKARETQQNAPRDEIPPDTTNSLPNGEPFNAGEFISEVDKIRKILLKNDPHRFDNAPNGGFSRAYFDTPLPDESCCEVARASEGRMHTRACETTRQAV